MKTLIRTLAYCSLLAAFTACERDLEPYSSTDCRLNFVYLDYTGEVMTSDRVTEAERTASYSFITAGTGANFKEAVAVIAIIMRQQQKLQLMLKYCCFFLSRLNLLLGHCLHIFIVTFKHNLHLFKIIRRTLILLKGVYHNL